MSYLCLYDCTCLRMHDEVVEPPSQCTGALHLAPCICVENKQTTVALTHKWFATWATLVIPPSHLWLRSPGDQQGLPDFKRGTPHRNGKGWQTKHLDAPKDGGWTPGRAQMAKYNQRRLVE